MNLRLKLKCEMAKMNAVFAEGIKTAEYLTLFPV